MPWTNVLVLMCRQQMHLSTTTQHPCEATANECSFSRCSHRQCLPSVVCHDAASSRMLQQLHHPLFSSLLFFLFQQGNPLPSPPFCFVQSHPVSSSLIQSPLRRTCPSIPAALDLRPLHHIFPYALPGQHPALAKSTSNPSIVQLIDGSSSSRS